MKFSIYNTIFTISLACLFALQGLWLHYAYRNENIKIRNILNESLLKAVEEEMDGRFSSINKDKVPDDYPGYCSDSIYEYKYDQTQGNLISQQYNFIQQILFYEGIYFNLTKVDSIFAASLHRNSINVQYRLNYTDSLGNNIESKGKKIDKGFSTNIIPVINEMKIGAIVKISSSTIFRSMLGILIVSILIFLLIIICLVYEVNIFLTQHHLHQLRKNFIRALSHDMKTPLATIHSVLAQLDNGCLDVNPEMKHKFNIIAMEQTKNLQTIVDQLLTTIYISKKQLNLNKQVIDLSQMIHSLIDRFMVSKEKNIEFSEKYDLKNTSINADPFYMGNAISNLIDNAVKYSENTVKIDIECAVRDKQLYIHVKDNGFGIPEKDRQKIFEPFERGAEIERKRMNGFGLGLNYVKHVIEAHGGVVSLISEEGIGSEFIIVIPLT